MNSKLSPVPSAAAADPGVNRHMQVVRENMNRLIGAVPGAEKIAEVPPTASLPEVIAALNAVIRRLT